MHGTSSGWRIPGYTEIRELGAGAGGSVVMARHDADGVLVAIKYLSDELRNDVAFVARFRQEARVLNTLDSPHSVQLYDYVETGEGSAIVMELVDGVALRALLRSEGPTGPEAALVVLKGSLLGLATAHTAGVVHRDFKPENVMVDASGMSKLVDFGIAVRAGDGEAPAGTPPYMAPEQWLGGPAGPSTDVYAATVVFFECLTGTRPFRATNIAALARQHQVTPPPVEEVPAPLRGLVERGLAKDPADRPPTAAAFLTELEAVAADAYGPEWQERGRRRLAGVALLLASLFPLGKAPASGVANTSLAQTDLGEGEGGGRRWSRSRSRSRNVNRGTSLGGKLGVKVLVGLGFVAAISGVTAVLVNAGDVTEIQTQGTATTQEPSPSEPVETIIPAEDTAEPTEEPTEEPPTEEPAEETPEPTTTAAPTVAGPPPAPPTGNPLPKPKPPVKPTKKPPVKPTKKPTLKPTKPPVKPSPSPSGVDTSDIGVPAAPSTRPATTPPPTPPPATAAPTRPPRPTRPPQPTSAPTEENPSPPQTSPRGVENPPEQNAPGSSEGTPRKGIIASLGIGTAAPALLTLKLMTNDAVPLTLTVTRGAVDPR
ncbi:serine/threonine-protein kinase [Streptosporangium sp. 'caverna']|uniref:serine/threonine-protein kinase n=1 Tax=Streptosporangium sp. 'caverna' TaxID=2202249 RepID=UPI000D7DA51E|nr:serine/threonine-protein kinase [Streptosporangium sp. 'caverna']AWS46024.1 serine/threonine protein kinase [Streptosporangium sp. 'caverna']